MSASFTSRRAVLAAAGTAGLTAAVGGCGDGSDDAPEQGATGAGGTELGPAEDIPEGGGKVFKDEKVVVTRPGPEEYKAYSATCTHKGCLVSEVADGTINCKCHGSRFDIADGSVTAGPATAPLEEAKVSVEGGSLRLDG